MLLLESGLLVFVVEVICDGMMIGYYSVEEVGNLILDLCFYDVSDVDVCLVF